MTAVFFLGVLVGVVLSAYYIVVARSQRNHWIRHSELLESKRKHLAERSELLKKELDRTRASLQEALELGTDR